MGLALYSLIPAAIAVLLVRDGEGRKKTFLACGLAFVLSLCIGCVAAYLQANVIEIPDMALVYGVIAAIVAFLWRNRSFIKPRPQNDLRN
jgi:hypothetical protein